MLPLWGYPEPPDQIALLFRHLQLKHVCQWDVGVGHALFSRKWEARGGAPLNLTRTKAVLAVESGLSLVHFSEQRAMAPPPVYGESCCWDPLGTCTRAQASCNSALLCCRYSTHHWSAETSLTPCNGKTCTSQSLNADVKRVSRKTCTDQISIGRHRPDAHPCARDLKGDIPYCIVCKRLNHFWWPTPVSYRACTDPHKWRTE